MLHGTLVEGGGRGMVVVAGATAVPHRYYAPFAAWMAAEHGVDVLCFDYRGVGASRVDTLRGFRAGYRDWASDLACAVDWAADRGPTVVVGHSFGGHAFGMTPAHARTQGMYTYGSGSGWHGWMTRAEGAKVWALWNLVLPPLVAWHGYLPFSRLGMGEDLPRGVYADWRRWCRHPNYFFDDPEAEFVDEFARVEVPVVGVNSLDDDWASPRSAEALLRHYPKAERVVVDPAEVGLRGIGHIAYFRPTHRVLWEGAGRFVRDRLEAVAA